MSSSNSFYLGPYVICERKYTTKERAMWTCPDVKCKRHGESRYTGAFCAVCGRGLADALAEKREPAVNVYETVEDLHERLADFSPPEYIDVKEDRYVPNCGGSNLVVGHFDGSGDSWLRADIVDNCETSCFLREFEAEVEVLRKAYGPQNVQVMWGLLAHWS